MASKEENKKEIKNESVKKDSKKVAKKDKKVVIANENAIPLIDLIEKSNIYDSIIVGVLEYHNLLDQFKQDIINERCTLSMTEEEFNKLIEDYLNRKI
ncbi:MAG: hypothetical protein J6Y78_10965 [Paludibacteraceae bacterium]|nr:hypothetical protein [Paludibacteraceae bacterium]